MKKALNMRLSLRKLLIATMAVGPLAVLPAPVWAVLPTYNPSTNSGSFTVANGSATVITAGNFANIQTTDRAVLVWGATTTGAPFTPDATTITNFNIQTPETYNFILPAGGAVLNRVRAGNVTAANNATYSGVAAYVAGSLLSNGKVIILSDAGNITVTSGATINTQGGLVLSALSDPSDGTFLTQGDVSLTGTPTGNITIGTAVVSGNLTAVGGTVSATPTTVGGDLVLRAVTSAAPIALGAGVITGNLSVTTNNAAISQTGAVLVGNAGGTQTTTLSSGTGDIALGNAANDFQSVTVQTTGTADVILADANIIRLGASTIGRDLTITARGQVNTNAIATTDTVTVGRNASLTAIASNNSGINIGHNSTIGGTVSAETAGGAITINTIGALTTGAMNSRNRTVINTLTAATVNTVTINATGSVTSVTLNPSDAGVYTGGPSVTFADAPAGGRTATGEAIFDPSTGRVTGVTILDPGTGYTAAPTVTLGAVQNVGRNIAVTTTGVLTVNGAVVTSNSATSPTVTFTGGSVAFTTAGSINNQGPVNVNSTAGDVVLGTITANRINSSAVGGNISQLAGTILRTNHTTGTSAFNAGTGSITLNLANNFASGSVVQLTGGNATLRSINAFVLGTSNVTGDVALFAPTAGTNITLGSGGGTAAQNITVGGTLSATTTGAGQILDNDSSAFNVFGGLNLAVVSAADPLQRGTGDIILNAATAFGSLAPRVQFGRVNASTNGNVTIAESTTLNLGDIFAANLTATSTGGGIIDTGTITLATTNATPDAGTPRGTFTAASNASVVLDSATNVLPNLGFGGGLNNSVTNLNSSVTISGNTTATGDITIGTNAGHAIRLGTSNITGNLALVSGGGIDINGVAQITGTLSMTTTGNLAPVAFVAPAQFAGGAITGVTVAGPTSATPGPTLSTLTFASAPTVTASAAPAGGTTATPVATFDPATGIVSAITVPAGQGGAGYVVAPAVTVGASLTGITESAGGALSVTGNTTISSSGIVNLFRGNDFNNVVLSNSAGSAIINDVNDLRISGSTAGTLTATAGGGDAVTDGPIRIPNTWALSLGNLSVGSLIAAAQNGGGGNSGTITQQAGTRIHSEGLARFTTTNANIIIGNNGNNFGRVELFVASTDANRTVTLVEDGTLRLGNLSSRGPTTLTSRFGSVIEDSGANVVITNNGTLTVNSPTGSILLGNTTHTVGTTTGNLTAFAASAPNGAVAVMSAANIALGNITALSLTVTSENNITQTGRLSIFGSSNFTASNNITLGNTTNNFGRVSLTTLSTGRDITITEGGTLNIGTVQMGSVGNATVAAVSSTGSFTATSVNGDIIDTGLAGARFGGMIAPSTAANAGTILIGSGLVSLNAPNGNIVIDDPTSDFHTSAGIIFNARNVTLSPLGRTTVVLGAANQTATATNLTVTSALGNITNAGPISVTEDAFFQTGSGNITLTNPGNRFGTVRFSGNQVRITQVNDINIVRGSSALGLAEFVSTGSYITIDPLKGSGIVTFGSTANFTAGSSILLPKLLQAAGTITVNAAGTKDLSALSISADLAGRSPINLGTGAYLPPQP